MFLQVHRTGFASLLVLMASFLTLLACSRENKDNESAASRALPAVIPKSTPSATSDESNGEAPLSRFRGVVYLSKLDSTAHVAIEREDGQVFLVTGEFRRQLENLHHRKVEVIGFIRVSETNPGVRDSIEVVDYEIVRGPDSGIGKG